MERLRTSGEGGRYPCRVGSRMGRKCCQIADLTAMNRTAARLCFIPSLQEPGTNGPESPKSSGSVVLVCESFACLDRAPFVRGKIAFKGRAGHFLAIERAMQPEFKRTPLPKPGGKSGFKQGNNSQYRKKLRRRSIFICGSFSRSHSLWCSCSSKTRVHPQRQHNPVCNFWPPSPLFHPTPQPGRVFNRKPTKCVRILLAPVAEKSRVTPTRA